MANDCNDDGGGDDVLLIQRYTDLKNNAYAALCNAVQEPGCVGFFGSMRRDRKEFLHYSRDLRLPHIYDVMTVLSRLIADGSTPNDAKDGDLCCFMGGFPYEAEQFTKLRPKIFFITANMNELNSHFPKWDIYSRVQLIVPVILRGDHYYIIIGKENFPVYRVHNPNDFFFSPDGRSLLLDLLTRCGENRTIETINTHLGQNVLYFLPDFKTTDGYPNKIWNELTIDQIKESIQPLHLVDEKRKDQYKWYVELVKLDDEESVADIFFPEKKYE